MNYASLKAALEALFANTYTVAAPRGLNRFIVLSRYGRDYVGGDGRNLMSLKRVQIDVYAQDPEDPLPARVEQLLSALDMSYELADEVYDDELARFRWIFQTEVL